ncbi:MAG: arylesterase [Proteobacteria bacterium]|nr:arylesterase [Pseudomonadota bacterium]
MHAKQSPPQNKRSQYTCVCLKAFFVFLAFFQPSPGFSLTILCLGDSLTEGYGLKPEEAWPSLLEASLKKNIPSVKVINAGISGATTASGPSRIKWHLKTLEKQPIDILILSLGANDALRGLDVKDSAKNLVTTIELAQEKKIKVFLTDIKAPPSLGAEFTKKFEAIYPQIAKTKKVTLIPFFLEGVAGNPKLNLPDGIHPNSEGQKIVHKNVENFLCKNIKCDSKR